MKRLDQELYNTVYEKNMNHFQKSPICEHIVDKIKIYYTSVFKNIT